MGYPLIRPMSFLSTIDDDDFVGDDKIWGITHQYMFGDDFLVAPVLDPLEPITIWPYSAAFNINNVHKLDPHGHRHNFVDVLIPGHVAWIHLWTGVEIYSDAKVDRYLHIGSPYGYPPVFYRKNSVHGQTLREFIISNGWDACGVSHVNGDVTRSHRCDSPIDSSTASMSIEWLDETSNGNKIFTTADYAVWMGLIPSVYASQSPKPVPGLNLDPNSRAPSSNESTCDTCGSTSHINVDVNVNADETRNNLNEIFHGIEIDRIVSVNSMTV